MAYPRKTSGERTASTKANKGNVVPKTPFVDLFAKMPEWVLLLDVSTGARLMFALYWAQRYADEYDKPDHVVYFPDRFLIRALSSTRETVSRATLARWRRELIRGGHLSRPPRGKGFTVRTEPPSNIWHAMQEMKEAARLYGLDTLAHAPTPRQRTEIRESWKRSDPWPSVAGGKRDGAGRPKAEIKTSHGRDVPNQSVPPMRRSESKRRTHETLGPPDLQQNGPQSYQELSRPRSGEKTPGAADHKDQHHTPQPPDAHIHTVTDSRNREEEAERVKEEERVKAVDRWYAQQKEELRAEWRETWAPFWSDETNYESDEKNYEWVVAEMRDILAEPERETPADYVETNIARTLEIARRYCVPPENLINELRGAEDWALWRIRTSEWHGDDWTEDDWTEDDVTDAEYPMYTSGEGGEEENRWSAELRRKRGDKVEAEMDDDVEPYWITVDAFDKDGEPYRARVLIDPDAP